MNESHRAGYQIETSPLKDNGQTKRGTITICSLMARFFYKKQPFWQKGYLSPRNKKTAHCLTDRSDYNTIMKIRNAGFIKTKGDVKKQIEDKIFEYSLTSDGFRGIIDEKSKPLRGASYEHLELR